MGYSAVLRWWCARWLKRVAKNPDLKLEMSQLHDRLEKEAEAEQAALLEKHKWLAELLAQQQQDQDQESNCASSSKDSDSSGPGDSDSSTSSGSGSDAGDSCNSSDGDNDDRAGVQVVETSAAGGLTSPGQTPVNNDDALFNRHCQEVCLVCRQGSRASDELLADARVRRLG